MTLLISLLLAGIVTSWALSRLLLVSPRLVLAVTPPLLVAVLVVASTLTAFVPGQPLSVRHITTILFGTITVLLAIYGAKINGRDELSGVFWSILPIALIGMGSAFIWWVLLRHQPPSDNDALVHAFTLRRMGEISGHPACLLPRDSTTLYGLRFVPCGSQLLGQLDVLRGFALSWRTVNSIYLLVAFNLPVGVAAFLDLVRPGSRRVDLLGAASSLVFLVLPYALNGVLPYLLGLSIALPTLGFAHEMSQRGGMRVLLAAMAVGGAALIHPTAGLISCVGLLGLARLPRTSVLRWTITGIVLIITGLLFAGPDLLRNLSDGLAAGTSTAATSGTGLVNQVMLGNSWTRAQPILLLLGGVGLLMAWRGGGSLVRLISLMSATLYVSWLTLGSQALPLKAMRLPFYGNWYRILGALELLLIPGVAISVDRILNLGRTGFRMISVAGTATIFLLSTVTGLRIVSQAWSRPISHLTETLSDFDSIPTTLQGPVLNDPTDGSAWAYVSSSLVLVAPVDRNPDILYANVIDDLPKQDARQAVCAAIEDSRIRYLLLTKTRQALKEVLREQNVIDPPIFSGKGLDVFPLTSVFLDQCGHKTRACVKRDTAPLWLAPLVEQRFRVSPDHIFCPD